MKSRAVATSIVLMLLAHCAFFLACAGAKSVTITIKEGDATRQPVDIVQLRDVTLTVTITRSITTTVEGVPKTITLQPAVYTPIFEREAPEIPHAYILELEHTGLDLYEDEGYPVCFCCHGQPKEHEPWLKDAEVCRECHEVSANPIIIRK